MKIIEHSVVTYYSNLIGSDAENSFQVLRKRRPPWNFTPDLENGLPKFRIYRNNSLIATLQGQERDGGDAPIYPHVVLEFRDKSTGENDIYAVSAFNSLGENISQSSHIVRETKINQINL